MAVVVRSSCALPRSNSARFSRSADNFLRETPVSRRLESLPLKVKRLITSFACSQIETNEALLGRKSIQLHFDHKRILQNSTADQDMMLMKSAPIAVLLTNALVLATPFEALAETCQAQQPMDQMPVFLLVAIIGATVGGLLARQRKGELKRVNEQLRQINAALRRQAKIESYAPNLSYAPVGSRVVEDNEVLVDPRKHKLIGHLKNGKNFLRNQDPEKAYVEFETALELARALEDPIEEKKAARGLGASLQRQGKFREAVKYHSMVLAISEREGEDSGNTEAYGAIADCYTEIGDLEKAGVYYDQYIARLQND